jgi:GMP synthase (glutamine-hydrolysing)
MSHRDTVFDAPPGLHGARLLDRVAGRRAGGRRARHLRDPVPPEVVHTPFGQDILKTFLADVCGCDMAWSAASIVEEQIARIREQVGDGRVICGLSGGVDSSSRRCSCTAPSGTSSPASSSTTA